MLVEKQSLSEQQARKNPAVSGLILTEVARVLDG